MSPRPRDIIIAIGLAIAASMPLRAATAPPMIVNAEWEQVEYIELPDGTVQVRARRKTVAGLAVATAIPQTSTGQPSTPALTPPPAKKEIAAKASSDKQTIVDSLKQTLAVDLSVPSSPAMAVLGMSGTEIQRPAFPRDFASSLVRGFTKDGKAKNALAIDIVPVALFLPGSLIGGEQYERSYWMRLKARTTVSLAAAQVEASKPASQLAAGIRLGLVDYADPGLYWRKTRDCVNAAIATTGIGPGKTLVDTEDVAGAVAQANKCTGETVVADLWAKPALYAGYAQGWYSDSGAIKDSSGSAKALWASLSVGIPRSQAQRDSGADYMRILFQLHLARKLDDRTKDPAGGELLVREDRSDAILRLRFGKERWHAFIDGGLSRVTTAGLPSERIRRIGLGVEYQLRDDLWLVVGSVTEKGFAAGDRNLVNTGLRFGQLPKASFGLPGAKGE
jgi:hypothetical protein